MATDFRWRASRLLLLVSATAVVAALGRLAYHFVLFQGTILSLTEF